MMPAACPSGTGRGADASRATPVARCAVSSRTPAIGRGHSRRRATASVANTMRAAAAPERGGREMRRDIGRASSRPARRQVLMNGMTAFWTVAMSDALSNASGAGGLPRSRRMSAAWRASTCAMAPAAARTSAAWIIGAAPL